MEEALKEEPIKKDEEETSEVKENNGVENDDNEVVEELAESSPRKETEQRMMLKMDINIEEIEKQKQKRSKILVIDDSILNRKIIRRIIELEDKFFSRTEIVEATGIEESFEIMERDDPDTFECVIIECSIHDLNVFEISSAFRSKYEFKKTIIGICGALNVITREDFIQAGFDDIVVRPLTKNNLLDVMLACLKKRRAKSLGETQFYSNLPGRLSARARSEAILMSRSRKNTQKFENLDSENIPTLVLPFKQKSDTVMRLHQSDRKNSDIMYDPIEEAMLPFPVTFAKVTQSPIKGLGKFCLSSLQKTLEDDEKELNRLNEVFLFSVHDEESKLIEFQNRIDKSDLKKNEEINVKDNEKIILPNEFQIQIQRDIENEIQNNFEAYSEDFKNEIHNLINNNVNSINDISDDTDTDSGDDNNEEDADEFDDDDISEDSRQSFKKFVSRRPIKKKTSNDSTSSNQAPNSAREAAILIKKWKKDFLLYIAQNPTSRINVQETVLNAYITRLDNEEGVASVVPALFPSQRIKRSLPSKSKSKLKSKSKNLCLWNDLYSLVEINQFYCKFMNIKMQELKNNSILMLKENSIQSQSNIKSISSIQNSSPLNLDNSMTLESISSNKSISEESKDNDAESTTTSKKTIVKLIDLLNLEKRPNSESRKYHTLHDLIDDELLDGISKRNQTPPYQNEIYSSRDNYKYDPLDSSRIDSSRTNEHQRRFSEDFSKQYTDRSRRDSTSSVGSVGGFLHLAERRTSIKDVKEANMNDIHKLPFDKFTLKPATMPAKMVASFAFFPNTYISENNNKNKDSRDSIYAMHSLEGISIKEETEEEEKNLHNFGSGKAPSSSLKSTSNTNRPNSPQKHDSQQRPHSPQKHDSQQQRPHSPQKHDSQQRPHSAPKSHLSSNLSSPNLHDHHHSSHHDHHHPNLHDHHHPNLHDHHHPNLYDHHHPSHHDHHDHNQNHDNRNISLNKNNENMGSRPTSPMHRSTPPSSAPGSLQKSKSSYNINLLHLDENEDENENNNDENENDYENFNSDSSSNSDNDSDNLHLEDSPEELVVNEIGDIEAIEFEKIAKAVRYVIEEKLRYPRKLAEIKYASRIQQILSWRHRQKYILKHENDIKNLDKIVISNKMKLNSHQRKNITKIITPIINEEDEKSIEEMNPTSFSFNDSFTFSNEEIIDVEKYSQDFEFSSLLELNQNENNDIFNCQKIKISNGNKNKIFNKFDCNNKQNNFYSKSKKLLKPISLKNPIVIIENERGPPLPPINLCPHNEMTKDVLITGRSILTNNQNYISRKTSLVSQPTKSQNSNEIHQTDHFDQDNNIINNSESVVVNSFSIDDDSLFSELSGNDKDDVTIQSEGENKNSKLIVNNNANNNITDLSSNKVNSNNMLSEEDEEDIERELRIFLTQDYEQEIKMNNLSNFSINNSNSHQKTKNQIKNIMNETIMTYGHSVIPPCFPLRENKIKKKLQKDILPKVKKLPTQFVDKNTFLEMRVSMERKLII